MDVYFYVHQKRQKTVNSKSRKEGKMTRYAVPLADGQLALHFGHAAQFAIIDYDDETKSITKNDIHTPPPHEPGVLPKWLHDLGVNIIIAGGISGTCLACAWQIYPSNAKQRSRFFVYIKKAIT